MIATATSRSTAQPRGCLATLAVLVVMIGIVAVGFYAQAAVADIPNQPVTVSDGVSLVPPPDWEFQGRTDDQNTILLSRGNGSLAITVTPGGDHVAALNTLRDEWTQSGTVSAGHIREATGVHGSKPAAAFPYSGTFADLASAVEGEVTAVRGTSVVVVFDGWADVGEYAGAADDTAAIIAETSIP